MMAAAFQEGKPQHPRADGSWAFVMCTDVSQAKAKLLRKYRVIVEGDYTGAKILGSVISGNHKFIWLKK